MWSDNYKYLFVKSIFIRKKKKSHFGIMQSVVRWLEIIKIFVLYKRFNKYLFYFFLLRCVMIWGF